MIFKTNIENYYKVCKNVLFSAINESLKHCITIYRMQPYLRLVSSTVMVEIRVELLITLILQFKFPWPSSSYWGWFSIKYKKIWNKIIIQKDTTPLPTIDFKIFISNSISILVHIHVFLESIPEVSNCVNGILYVCLQVCLQLQNK